jgi:hypothetical protein
MARVERRTLEQVLRESGRVAVADALRVAGQSVEQQPSRQHPTGSS